MGKHLAIDIGADTGRAIVGWLEQDRLVMRELHRFPTRNTSILGKRTRNIYRWYEEIVTALHLYVREYGSCLDSVGVNAMGHEFSLLDGDGQIIRFPMSYRDSKFGRREVNALIEQRMGKDTVYQITGNQAMDADTFVQFLIAHENREEAFQHAKGLLFLADTMHYLLGARPCCEMSLASYSRLLNQRNYTWSEELFQAFDFNRKLGMPLVWAGETIGVVDRELCAQVGLETQPWIITPCGHDTADAVVAMPDCFGSSAFISSGTWSLLGFETATPVISPASCQANVSNSTTGFGRNMFKKNVTGMWLVQQCHTRWNIPYDEIVLRARQADSMQMTIDVDASRYMYTTRMAQAIAEDLQERYGKAVSPDDSGLLARVIYESMAMKDRYTFEKIFHAMGKTPDNIVVLGGGAQNHYLCQLIANVMNLDVYAGHKEATAFGNLAMQLYGCGELTSRKDVKRTANRSVEYMRFSPQEPAVWQDRYERFLSEHVFENLW